VPKGAAPYDSEEASQWSQELLDADPAYLSSLCYALISVMFCAQRRGDAVGSWFRDLVQGKSPDETEKTFATIREAITIVYPFLGLPNCVPACFGMVSVLKDKGIDSVQDRRRYVRSQEEGSLAFHRLLLYAHVKTFRADVHHPSIHEQGLETRKRIYRGVGNPEVHQMMQKHFPDMTYATDCFIFGYLATGSLDMFSLRETELIITAAITAMGATRQSQSHIKASMQLGNSTKTMSAVVSVASKMARWSGHALSGPLDVGSLEQELHANLAAELGQNDVTG
jgi:alkylhydroperoxidase/carboxymuconolactone decarboxylase family protein YurZ